MDKTNVPVLLKADILVKEAGIASLMAQDCRPAFIFYRGRSIMRTKEER